ncbi:MAG: CBASS cGAMP synthase [Candidatus Thiodiazotropha endolucinida]
MNNLSPLFFKHTHSDRFLNNISISGLQDQMLRDARKKIRTAILSAFADVRKYLGNRGDFDKVTEDAISKIVPKFMTQGSYAYRTLNAPWHASQQIDLDDGVYLPMKILEDRPELSKEWFFDIIDNALTELAEAEGWEVCTDKDTCCRVILRGKQAHIDVPLYAMPDELHGSMVEEFAATRASLSMEYILEDHLGTKRFIFDPTNIYLATRNNGWKRSDPLKIARWFQHQIKRKGERLRRACRFLKAWRDFIWESGGPSSITLMVLADKAYPDQDDQGRDDYVLLKIAETLPEHFRGTVNNPVDDQEPPLYPRGDIDQDEVVFRAERLLKALQQTIAGAISPEEAIAKMQETFSDRYPNRPEWIEAVSVANLVRNTKPVKVRPEPIGNMRSA